MSLLNRVAFSNVLRSTKGSPVSSRLLPRNLQNSPKNRITSYIVEKGLSKIKWFETALKKKFPTAMKLYQVYAVGLKALKEEILIWFRSYKKVNAVGFQNLTRKELEVYYKMPQNVMKTAMLIVAVSIPGGGFIFAVAHYFPRQLLTYHFWSLQQKSEFSLYYHRKKLQCFKPVFRCMQQQLVVLKDKSYYEPMKKMLDKLESGVHPSTELILSCKPLFENRPYGLKYLTRSHVKNLIKLYGLHRGCGRRKRLAFKASLIHLMDSAIVKEGGLEKLSQDELKWNCFLRGLNPINMKAEDISKWMDVWLSVSKQIDKNSYSLLLHCPILLGYNQPSNLWLLLKKKRR